jgi:NADPH:quinone reductase-like Zn-dependent oxidoreductase
MKAIVRERYGRPSVLELRDVERPELGDDQVLVRVHASSINASEWYDITGPLFARPTNGVRSPKQKLVMGEVAGTVEAVGKSVGRFKPGDEVFGTAFGAWAEYAAAREARLAIKPAGVSFEEAAAAPIAGLTALQGLRDQAEVQPGQKVLINGASGGVGTYAVQLAKWLGADVTAVCSTRNVEQARALGADRVIDYTNEDYTHIGVRHDALIDVAGSRSFTAMRRVVTPDGTIVLVGGKMTYRGLGPLPHLGATILAGKLRRRPKLKFFVADIDPEDLALLGKLLESGEIRSVIDRRYELSQTVEAVTYFGEGHARAKVVLTM